MKTYKRIGETTGDLSNRLKKEHGYKKVAICGKLDPMARGITNYLADDDTKQMQNYLNNIKTYEFDIVLGIKTDTDDIMGIISDYRFDKPDCNALVKTIQSLINQDYQKFHPYSAIKYKINGERKSLHQWTNENKLTYEELPGKKVNVFDIQVNNIQTIKLKSYIQEIFNRLQTIDDMHKTSFRVNDIIHSWEQLSKNYEKNEEDIELIKIPVKMIVSAGYYIRMIAYDLYNRMNVPCHIFDIHRTHT